MRARSFNLTLRRVAVLAILNAKGSLYAAELSRQTLAQLPDLVGQTPLKTAVKRLVQEGSVENYGLPVNRVCSNKPLRITAKGKTGLTQMLKSLNNLHNLLTELPNKAD